MGAIVLNSRQTIQSPHSHAFDIMMHTYVFGGDWSYIQAFADSNQP
jgi:hypothetical protein